MKRSALFIAVLLTVLLMASDLLANIDNLSNMSVEWMRTGNRNAATDRADAVIYNPGGITELPDGVSINIGNQSMKREPQHSYNLGAGEQSFEQDGNDPFLPNIYGAYNKDNWAVWGGIYIPGGGAVVDYPNGSITTNALIPMGIAEGIATQAGDLTLTPTIFGGFTVSDTKLEAESIYLTATLGGTYEVNDMVSVAFGMRYIDADKNIKGGAKIESADVSPGGINDQLVGAGLSNIDIDMDQEADGFGFILGLNANPTDKMNVGIQYQSRVELDFKATQNKTVSPALTVIPADGTKERRDLPAMLGLGVGYDISDKIYVEVNYSYWFQEDADWGKTKAGKDISDMAGDTQSYGATATYKWTPAIATSVGAVYTDFLWNDRDGYYQANIGSYEVLYTDNWQVCGGVSWQVNDTVELTASLARTLWDDATLQTAIPNVKVETENASTILSLGANLTF